LNEFEFFYTVYADGRRVAGGDLPGLECPPGETVSIEVPVNEVFSEPGIEYFFNVYARIKSGSGMLPTGYVVASEQFDLPYTELKEMTRPGQGPGLQLTETEDRIKVAGNNFYASIGKNSGTLDSYVYDYKELILQAPIPYFWREPNDNDHGFGMAKRMKQWKLASENRVLKNIEVLNADTRQIEVKAEFELPDIYSTYDILYTIDMDGELSLTASLHIGDSALPDMPRFGFYMEMDGSFDDLKWYGRGPFENYVDRKTAAFVGLYGGKVADQHVSYIRPQENGNKCDVRWMKLMDSRGNGLTFSSDGLIEFTVQHYRPEDITQETRSSGMHSVDVPKRKMIGINLDLFQMGVGGNNSWGARPIEKYRYPAKDYSFTMQITPVAR
jgi:beta-galactosidase